MCVLPRGGSLKCYEQRLSNSELRKQYFTERRKETIYVSVLPYVGIRDAGGTKSCGGPCRELRVDVAYFFGG